MIINLSEQNSIVNQFMAEIRNVDVQHDRMRFRRNIERIGEISAYEISKGLEYVDKEITTPLGSLKIPVLKQQPVLGTILRAGLPLHHGLLNFFDRADNTFISAYRHHLKDGSFEIKLEYFASAPIDDRVLIIADPMLATGASMLMTLNEVFKYGKPKQTHVVSVIASKQGIDLIKSNLPEVTIWAGAIDEKLDSRAYIVPGLGDAGDLAFGDKTQN